MPESVTADIKQSTTTEMAAVTISGGATAEASPAAPATEPTDSDKSKMDDAKESDTVAETPVTETEGSSKFAGEKSGKGKETMVEKEEDHRHHPTSKKDEKKERSVGKKEHSVAKDHQGNNNAGANSTGAHFADALKTTPAKKFEDGMKKTLEEIEGTAKEVENDETRQKLTTLISKAKFLLDDSAELFNKMGHFSMKKQSPNAAAGANSKTNANHNKGGSNVAGGSKVIKSATKTAEQQSGNANTVQQRRAVVPQSAVNMSVQRRLFGNRPDPSTMMTTHHPAHFNSPPNYGPEVMFHQHPGFQSHQQAQQQPPHGASFQSRIPRMPAGPGNGANPMGWTLGVYPIVEGALVPNQRRSRRDIVLREQNQANVRRALREATTASQLEKAVTRAQRLHMTYEVGNAKVRLQKMKTDAAGRAEETPAEPAN